MVLVDDCLFSVDAYHEFVLTIIYFTSLLRLVEENEVAASGKLSPNTHTLPLSILGSQQVFEMDEDEFEIVCGFPKPTPDETLVFSCAAGIRSKNACAYAAQAGYTKLVNYMGGAYEWFA